MSMSIPDRKESCLRFIRSGFNAPQTTAWMLTEFANEPKLQRSKNPETLCRNIITMGGSGLEKEANIAAFNSALDIHAAQERDREAAASRLKVTELESDLRTQRERTDAAQSEAARRQAEINELNRQLNTKTHEVHTYQLAEAKVPSAV